MLMSRTEENFDQGQESREQTERALKCRQSHENKIHPLVGVKPSRPD